MKNAVQERFFLHGSGYCQIQVTKCIMLETPGSRRVFKKDAAGFERLTGGISLSSKARAKQTNELYSVEIMKI
ncbi:MAG: hypothetical protein M1609_15015 [Firmicutes bacterium]|nr:hypothetical protein [Bacillota bacterium]MCL5781049.1 hypothetical protein [Bacillota bacterium]